MRYFTFIFLINILFGAGVLSTALAYVLDADETKISLNSVILFSLHNNPDIEIFWEQFEQSKSFIEEAEAEFYPEVTLNMEGGREFNDPSSGTNPPQSDINYTGTVALRLEQLIFDGFASLREVDRRRNLSEAAFWRIQSEIENTISDSVEFYLDMVRFQEELKANQALVTDIKGTLKDIETQFELGEADKVVLDFADSRLSSAISEVQKSQSSLNDAKSNLEFLTGRLPPNMVAFYPELLNPDKLDLEYYLKALEGKNALVIANKYEVKAMQEQYEVQKADYYPEVNLRLNADQTHNSGGEIGRERELSAIVSMDYTIFDGFRRNAAKQRVRSQIDELAIRQKQVLKELGRDLKLAYNQIKAGFETLKTLEREIKSSEELKALNEENFRLGNINIIELIESAERLNDARLRKVELIDELYFNSFRLLLISNIIDQHYFCKSC